VNPGCVAHDGVGEHAIAGRSRQSGRVGPVTSVEREQDEHDGQRRERVAFRNRRPERDRRRQDDHAARDSRDASVVTADHQPVDEHPGERGGEHRPQLQCRERQ
jgi:hypothetical protein